MQKGAGGQKAQLTAFIIVGIVIAILAGLAIYGDHIKQQATSGFPRTLSETEAARNLLTQQVQRCLSSALESGTYRIGKNGGYIDVTGSFTYGDEGELELYADGPAFVVFRGQPAAYGVAQQKNRILPLDASIAKLRRYVLVEMNGCDLNSVTKQGWSIQQPRVPWTDADFDSSAVMLNYSNKKPDVNIIVLPDKVMATLTYPVVATAGTNVVSVDSYTTSIPVRLRLAHSIANKIANATVDAAKQNKPFMLTPDCAQFVTDNTINIYAVSGVQIVDSAPIQRGGRSFIYQYGIADARIEGRCGS